ncbi:hypothetical protein QQS21_001184 [Conoideocrella luteorostrata]|uniref:Aminoglycoside phosphotransferase domain-containing protein n=1 Tax=Conoideocrella luteorostrata TaxID=1105319 RepID=A0AAJ0FYG6_9HYPO|nr:hypothetical protein QQS21_001184 [Conoideocrella luteorostrata]
MSRYSLPSATGQLGKLGRKEPSRTGLANPPNSEADNLRFVRKNTTIPVPAAIDDWTEQDRHFIITERVPGTPLSEEWPSLSESRKDNDAEQTVEYLQQLRSLCSVRVQSIDEQLWDEMAKGLKNAPQDLQDRLRNCMPTTQPYIFAHGDLTLKNIIVQKSTVTGIVDWEGSGHFPAWWEFVSTAIIDSKDDRSWKNLLRSHMEAHDAALQF